MIIKKLTKYLNLSFKGSGHELHISECTKSNSLSVLLLTRLG